jgi:hypothetical protein
MATRISHFLVARRGSDAPPPSLRGQDGISYRPFLVIQLVSLDRGDTGRVILAAHNRGVGIWGEGHENRRLGINCRGIVVAMMSAS